ncbi:tyrosine-type recombinase/integrase [Arsukibacterium indicum]|uniref:Tyrosine-type recombinase/integrase n=1 Tax=Arsukibacterium indicum TaxID=2848612 RepID=A0ABS6MGJ4_9GAMM|nr:tyrosine-type recombinase/integrase [Arsukibacterium indicum]MBV2127941.1 tyrosine-type recombinase/integrase [Arsukibacterium indicum]
MRYENGKRLRDKIGSWPELKTKDAMALVPVLLSRIGNGDKLHISEFKTVGDMLNWYLARLDAEQVKSQSRRKGVASAIKKHLMPRLQNILLCDVKKITIDERLMLPLQNASLRTSTIKQYFATLKRVFASATELSLITVNPMASMRFRDHVQKRIEPKKGKLQTSDVGRIVQQIMALPEKVKHLLLLMLLFATRIGETRQLRWNYIDFDAGQIVIPGRITKTGVTHILPLTGYAKSVLINYKQQASGPYLFGGNQPISSSEAYKLVRSVSGRKWSAHDLRKVARSCWTELAIDYWVAERLLNHAQRGLDLVYINADSMALKSDALERYHLWVIERLTTASQAPMEDAQI